jgi:hypothetical protein
MAKQRRPSFRVRSNVSGVELTSIVYLEDCDLEGQFTCPDCGDFHFDLTEGFVTFEEALRRASPRRHPLTGRVIPDKAKGQQLQTVDLSAPHIPRDGTTGVENKYSR